MKTNIYFLGHLHQVRSFGRSLSVSTLWTPTKSFNDSGCVDLDMDSHVSMDDMQFVWKLNKEVCPTCLSILEWEC